MIIPLCVYTLEARFTAVLNGSNTYNAKISHQYLLINHDVAAENSETHDVIERHVIRVSATDEQSFMSETQAAKNQQTLRSQTTRTIRTTRTGDDVSIAILHAVLVLLG